MYHIDTQKTDEKNHFLNIFVIFYVNAYQIPKTGYYRSFLIIPRQPTFYS